MLTFEDYRSRVVLTYTPDGFNTVSWLDDKLNADGRVTLSRVFTVQSANRLDLDEENYEDVRSFVIGSVGDEYRTIRKDVLGLSHDLLISKSIPLKRSLFVAERNISIFGRIDDLIEEPIVVGGKRDGAIPEDEFAELLHAFPTSAEVTYYAATRIARILREYLETMSDADRRLQSYIERRERSRAGKPVHSLGRIPAATALELEKFTYVRDRYIEMLNDVEGYTEAAWQEAVADLFLLVFPQYVAILHNVRIKELYTRESKSTDRYIDLMLVGSNGCVDIIEIKKPLQRGLVSKGQYRDNHVPVRELSGSIMQAEKYLFYLSKSGREGEKLITKEHLTDLPSDFEIKIANPKAIIFAGRDSDLSERERFDFEFVRREYSNVVDIISYDDLLRRLENVITALAKRASSEGDSGRATTPTSRIKR